MKTGPISPKVTASTVTAVLVALLLANITLVTPEMFSGLGAYGPLVYGVVVSAAGAVAGWWKTDPLRAPAPVPVEPAPAPAEPAAAFPNPDDPALHVPSVTPGPAPAPAPTVYDPLIQ